MVFCQSCRTKPSYILYWGRRLFFSEVVDRVYKSGFELSNNKFGQVTHRFFIHYNYQPLPDERRLQRTSANRPPTPLSSLVLPKMAFSAQNIQGVFFNCSAQISVLNRKMLVNQRGSFVHREFHGTESLIGCPSFFILVLKIGRNS